MLELERLQENYMTQQQALRNLTQHLSLIQELEIAVELLKTGLALLQRSRLYRSPRFAYMTLLANGLERLMKVILILEKLHTAQQFLTKDELKHLRHDLNTLLQTVETLCFTSTYLQRPVAMADQQFLQDAVVQQLIALLGNFGQQGRYAYMDATADPGNAPDHPDKLWDELESSLVPDYALLSSQGQETEAKRQAVTAMLMYIERLIRTLARLLMLGALGPEGQRLATIVGDFARLDDQDLGKNNYESLLWS